MKRIVVFLLSLIFTLILCSCVNNQASGVKLPDGVSHVKYIEPTEDAYEIGDVDIYKASANELKKISLASFDKAFGKVDNERTAADIATIVFRDIYPESNCNTKESPFVVYYNNTARAWIVHGTLPSFTVGGVATCAIDKESGKVIMLIHTK